MGAITGGQDRTSISANAIFSLIGQLTGACFTAGLTIFLTRDLGARSYGVLSLALGIVGLVVVPSDAGISNSVARLVAEQHGRPAGVLAAVRDGLQLKVLAATAFALLVFLLAPAIAGGYRLHALTWPLRGAAIGLLGENLMQMGIVFVAARRTQLQWVTALAESVVETTATVLLVLAGAGAAGAAFGQTVGCLAGAAATLALLARLLGPDVLKLGLRPGPHARQIATYGSVLLLVDGAFTAFTQIDTLIIAADRHAAQVAIFSAPMRLIVLLGYPGGALAAGVAPRMARAAGLEPDRAAFTAALRLVLIMQVAITVMVLGWATLIVKVTLGGGYEASAPALRELAPYVFLSGFGALVSVAANYLGEARRRVPVAVATLLVNLVLDLVLVPHLGVLGACIGSDVAFGIYVPAHLLICRSAVGLRLAPLALTGLRAGLAGAAMLGCLLALGDRLGRPLATLAGLALGAVVFAALLVLSGEITAAERRQLAGLLKRRPGARG